MLNTNVLNLDPMSDTPLSPGSSRPHREFRDPVLSGGPCCPLNDALYNMNPNVGAELMNYARAKGGDIISLAQGEGCMPTPPFIIEAATRAMTEGQTFYSRPLGLPELRQELSDYYKRIYDLDIDSDRIFISPSGSNAMNVALRALLNVGDEVVAVTPIWKNLLGAAELSGAKVIQSPLVEDENGWHLDLEHLFACCTENTKALLIVSPSNPTGWCITADEIRAIMEFARERGIWVISDEVYSRLVYDGTHAETFLDYADPEDLLIVINSFSKSWAMTGWRLGWITAPAFMADRIRLVTIYNNLCVAPFIQKAGITALKDGEEFIKNQLSHWDKNRNLVFETLKSYDSVRITKPQSSFYAFFRVRHEPDCIKFAYRLIDQAGLSLAPGITFGDACKGYIRMSFACSREKIEKSLDRLTAVL